MIARAARRRIALAALLPALVACGPRGHSEGYLAACHGEPLATPEAREEAMVEGYEIRPGYDCIAKESWAAVQAEKARWAAANTPQAKAEREARRQAEHAEAMRATAERRRSESAVPPMLAKPEPIDITPVDVNTASEARLAAVVSLDAEVAAQIVAARRERPFADWDDLVARVAGLGSAQTAAFASVCGLTVNGDSLSGAPPDVYMALQIRKRFQP